MDFYLFLNRATQNPKISDIMFSWKLGNLNLLQFRAGQKNKIVENSEKRIKIICVYDFLKLVFERFNCVLTKQGVTRSNNLDIFLNKFTAIVVLVKEFLVSWVKREIKQTL